NRASEDQKPLRRIFLYTVGGRFCFGGDLGEGRRLQHLQYLDRSGVDNRIYLVCAAVERLRCGEIESREWEGDRATGGDACYRAQRAVTSSTGDEADDWAAMADETRITARLAGIAKRAPSNGSGEAGFSSVRRSTAMR